MYLLYIVVRYRYLVIWICICLIVISILQRQPLKNGYFARYVGTR